MMLNQIGAIACGAVLGALFRWYLSNHLAQATSLLALGTLIANWLGAFLIGMAAALFDHYPALSPQWKLLLITGFLGSLTTFSSFSLEVVHMLQAQRYAAALFTASLHLIGSLAFTCLGMAIINSFRS